MTSTSHRVPRTELLGLIAYAGCLSCAPVTAPEPSDPTYSYAQSETSIAVAASGSSEIAIVAYNDDTPVNPSNPLIRYDEFEADTRNVYYGSSQMGWSYRHRR